MPLVLRVECAVYICCVERGCFALISFLFTFPDGFKPMLLNIDNDQTVYNDVFYTSRPGLQTFYQPPDRDPASSDAGGQKGFSSNPMCDACTLKRWASALVCSVHIISLC